MPSYSPARTRSDSAIQIRRRRPMGVLKSKQENEAITSKLPAALKREIETLRSRAEGAGFGLGETITPAMWRLCKQIKAELEGAPRPGRKLNGRGSEPSPGKLP